jgi:3-hydroxyacyl-[acyl-carrier-protein] dehydratase
MPEASLVYPFELDADGVAQLLPHRGEMHLVKHLTVLAHNHYKGVVQWSADSAILRGHFPGLPLVPGALLVEAVAQVAGAGLLAGDPCVQSMGKDYIGVLAGIRKCSFKRPVLPGDAVAVEVTCRQMSETAVVVSGTVKVGNEEAASVEIFIVNSSLATIRKHLAEVGVPATPP